MNTPPPLTTFARSLGITTSTKKQVRPNQPTPPPHLPASSSLCYFPDLTPPNTHQNSNPPTHFSIPAKPPLHPQTSLTLSQSTYGSLEGDKFLEDEDNLNLSLSMYSTDDDETGTLLKGRTKSATSSAFERALNSASSKSDCPCLPSCCSPTDPYYSETKTSPFSHFLQKKSKTVSLLCLVVLGMSNVVPWLAFISCGDYFTFLFPTRNTGFIFPVLNMTLLTFGTILTTFYGRNLSLYVRLLLTNIIIIFLLLSVPLYIGPAYDKRELEEGTALTLTYAVLGLCSLCVAVNQSSCYGVAGVFGSEFICSLER